MWTYVVGTQQKLSKALYAYASKALYPYTQTQKQRADIGSSRPTLLISKHTYFLWGYFQN